MSLVAVTVGAFTFKFLLPSLSFAFHHMLFPLAHICNPTITHWTQMASILVVDFVIIIIYEKKTNMLKKMGE